MASLRSALQHEVTQRRLDYDAISKDRDAVGLRLVDNQDDKELLDEWLRLTGNLCLLVAPLLLPGSFGA